MLVHLILLSSGGFDVGEEAADFLGQALGVAREFLSRAEHLRGSGTGLAGALAHTRDVDRHLLRALGGFLHVAGDLLGRRALLLHGGGDRGGVARHLTDDPTDRLDVRHRFLRRGLYLGDPLADLVRGLRGLSGKLLDLGGDHRKATACLTRARGLDGGVQRQQVRLARRCWQITDTKALIRSAVLARRRTVASVRWALSTARPAICADWLTCWTIS